MSKRRSALVRFGLIGHGTHAQWAIVPAMRAARGIKLVAVADINRQNLAPLRGQALACYTSQAAMLAREDLDAVYVATPVAAHSAATLLALRSGLHVITEKPMAASVAQCRQMLAAARRADRLLAVDFESRYMPVFRQVQRWVAEGRLGRLGAIHIDHMWDGHKIWGPLGERRRRFLDHTGCLDCGIHKLDLARYFAGGGTWQKVRAAGHWFGERVKYPPHISIMARLDNEVLVTFNLSFAFTAYIRQRLVGGYEGLALLGEKGVIILRPGARPGSRILELASASLTRSVPVRDNDHPALIARLLTDFAAAIRRGKPLPPAVASGEDGLMAQLGVDAANRLARRAAPRK